MIDLNKWLYQCRYSYILYVHWLLEFWPLQTLNLLQAPWNPLQSFCAFFSQKYQQTIDCSGVWWEAVSHNLYVCMCRMTLHTQVKSGVWSALRWSLHTDNWLKTLSWQVNKAFCLTQTQRRTFSCRIKATTLTVLHHVFASLKLTCPLVLSSPADLILS